MLTIYFSPTGGGLPLLPGGQHVYVPGARVCAQHRGSALPVPSAGCLQRPADQGTPAAEHAEPPVLCAGPCGCLQEGSAGAAHKPEKRYLQQPPRAPAVVAQSPQGCPQKRRG